MTHRRRDVLALLATGAAGCTAVDVGGDGPTKSGTATPAAAGIEEVPRVDEPPHDPERPERPEDAGSGRDRQETWDENYLGAGMETDSPLAYESVVFPLREPLDVSGGYRVRFVDSAERAREAFDPRSDDLSWFDFEDRLLVVVESGYGSGSVEHRWARAEPFERGIHLHGYYTKPLWQTSDRTPHVSRLAVEPPAGGVDFVRASLTVDVETRVHFNSTEGVVVPDEN